MDLGRKILCLRLTLFSLCSLPEARQVLCHCCHTSDSAGFHVKGWHIFTELSLQTLGSFWRGRAKVFQCCTFSNFQKYHSNDKGSSKKQGSLALTSKQGEGVNAPARFNLQEHFWCGKCTRLASSCSQKWILMKLFCFKLRKRGLSYTPSMENFSLSHQV